MRRYIGWRYRDEEGRKWQVAVHFHAGVLIWQRQAGRDINWETFEPTAEWWESLEGEADRFAGRGKITRAEREHIRKAAAAAAAATGPGSG